MADVHNPLVSVVIPTLNEEEHIGSLIDSIFKQDYRPIEVLVVDGGSKDRTVEIVRKKQKELNSNLFNIRILFEKDFGVLRSLPNARNIGIEQSTGDYLILVDADFCFIEGDSISKIKKKLDEVEFCCVRTKPLIDTELEHQIALGDVWHVHLGAFRRKIFDKHKFNPQLFLGEDRDFWFRAGLHFGNICETTLGRHFPHTFEEYKKQQMFYGRTYLRYLKILIKERRPFPLFWDFFSILLKNIFFSIMPIALVVSCFISPKLFFALLLLLILTFLIGLYQSQERSTLRQLRGKMKIRRLGYLIWRSFFEAYYFMYGMLSSLI